MERYELGNPVIAAYYKCDEVDEEIKRQDERIRHLESGLCIQEYEDERAKQAEQIKDKDWLIKYHEKCLDSKAAEIERLTERWSEAVLRETAYSDENQRLKQAILKYGKGNDFDWDVLAKIERLEAFIAEWKDVLLTNMTEEMFNYAMEYIQKGQDNETNRNPHRQML